jgi:hypothetical protein
MELWSKIRRRVLTGELTKRAACREYDLHWETLEKILAHVEPPGYRRTKPRRKPKIEPFLPVIHEILEAQVPAQSRRSDGPASRLLQLLLAVADVRNERTADPNACDDGGTGRYAVDDRRPVRCRDEAATGQGTICTHRQVDPKASRS